MVGALGCGLLAAGAVLGLDDPGRAAALLAAVGAASLVLALAGGGLRRSSETDEFLPAPEAWIRAFLARDPSGVELILVVRVSDDGRGRGHWVSVVRRTEAASVEVDARWSAPRAGEAGAARHGRRGEVPADRAEHLGRLVERALGPPTYLYEMDGDRLRPVVDASRGPAFQVAAWRPDLPGPALGAGRLERPSEPPSLEPWAVVARTASVLVQEAQRGGLAGGVT